MSLLARLAGGIAVLALLIWPALLNGYPLVFADTGTYLSQAIQRYLGWDRPAVYSVFLFLLHWKMTTWVAVLIQAALTAYVLDMLRRAFVPAAPRWMLLPGVALLCLATPLPWFAGQLMPDLFTSLLALVIAVVILKPEQVSRPEFWGLALLASGMVAVHLSNIWIGLALVLVLVPVRRRLGARTAFGWRGVRRVMAPIALAVFVLCTINLAAFGRFSVSPFGNVFLLARLVYDGPAEATLETDCSATKWRLCDYLPVFPPHHTVFPNSDLFLWRSDGPLAKLGGAKVISGEAKQIIVRTLQEHPAAVVGESLDNFSRQFLRFRSGDGLNPWPGQVGPIISRSFPARENRAFLGSLQNRGLLHVPGWLGALHVVAFWAGLAATIACLVVGAAKREPLALLCAAVLLCLLANAAVTGILSGPHDRYQNRVIWLAMVVPLLVGCRFWSARLSPRRLVRHG